MRRTPTAVSLLGLLAGLATAPPAAAAPPRAQGPTDRAVTTAGDKDGLHILVADQSDGYAWRTAATLREPEFDTTAWIGDACVTASGRRAVVVYAPREFTNTDRGRDAGGFVAVVDLGSGAVRKLAERSSLAYFNPGCGAGEEATVATSGTSTAISVLDAATGRSTMRVTVPGQVTSAVPYAGRIAAVSGDDLVAVGPGGAVRVLERAAGQPFRLHPERGGGLVYEVAGAQGTAQVRRWTGRRSTALGSAPLGEVRLHASAGRVFVTGPARSRIHGVGVTAVPGPVDAEPSSTGALVVTDAVLRSRDRIDVAATRTATGVTDRSGVRPEAPRPAEGAAPSPALAAVAGGAPKLLATDPATVPWDPDRSCSVPRNDPQIQAFQATAAQVEWAADLAVAGKLLINRPANWKNSGMPNAWQPQVLFPRRALVGGGQVPAQVLLGTLAQESNTMHASPHAVDGQNGNFNQGGFYGWGDHSSWSNPDCGYGVGQVTSGMALADGASLFTPVQQKAIATDYASNVAASLNMLIDKWNQLKTAGIVVNGGDPRYLENWYFAAWAYNTGVQPNGANGNTTGCTPSPSCTDSAGYWGLGWANNPANPNYPVDRGTFDGKNDEHTKHPNRWPYQEKVLGWAYTPVGRYNYAAGEWRPAYTRSAGEPHLPAHVGEFCDPQINQCQPGAATDVNGKGGAGRCLLANLHCWWHVPWQFASCTPAEGEASPCGIEVLKYVAGDPEPSAPNVYPVDCDTSGFPAGTAIVDDVTVGSPLPCGKSWTDSGSFALNFPYTTTGGCTSNCIHYPGKIDFHQLSAGFGGHLWFAHSATNTTVTGTWTPPASRTGWTRIKVHVPLSGGTTEQADYLIRLGNGQVRHGMVNQYWWQNNWVDLGTFDLAAGASVSLSNASSHVAASKVDGGDVAFDAIAFIPSTRPAARYVALGDSYSSGEGNPGYEEDTVRDPRNKCHRSLTKAYPSMVKLPGHAQSIATEAAANAADFHFLACSGAQSVDLTQAAVTVGNTDNTIWGWPNNYHYGEVNQIDDSGWLDEDTTLVTVSIGGNDVDFGDILSACIKTSVNCVAEDYVLTRSWGDADPKTNVKDPQPLIRYEPYLVDRLQSHLVSVYEQIHVRAPHAKIVVVGYPRLFRNWSPVLCHGLLPEVQAWMNGIADRLTQSIALAVQVTRTDYPGVDITFADPTLAFTGHAVCEVGEVQWINGIVPSEQSGSFHPNNGGHVGYADLVNTTLASG
ncbi:SGNH/GDSL hydrolase family protein [Micromonospora sp. NPDC049836]|uniref:SGNH/GDSL hydrolase family protein n=1 Tax=Micromonospora sp. NPDC049836 TaxID=3364274 RepID=UPI0037AE2262